MSTNTPPLRMAGTSLIELSIVLLAMAIMAGISLPYLGRVATHSECVATRKTLEALRSAIMDTEPQAGFYADMLRYPAADADDNTSPTGISVASLSELFRNPVSGTSAHSWNPTIRRGWRGPYVQGGISCTEIEQRLANALGGGYGLMINGAPVQDGAVLRSRIDPFGFCAENAQRPPKVLALDSFRVTLEDPTGSRSMQLLTGSPIVLMWNPQTHTRLLVSGGPDHVIQTFSDASTSDDLTLHLEGIPTATRQDTPCQ
mgnify:FL=1